MHIGENLWFLIVIYRKLLISHLSLKSVDIYHMVCIEEVRPPLQHAL